MRIYGVDVHVHVSQISFSQTTEFSHANKCVCVFETNASCQFHIFRHYFTIFSVYFLCTKCSFFVFVEMHLFTSKLQLHLHTHTFRLFVPRRIIHVNKTIVSGASLCCDNNNVPFIVCRVQFPFSIFHRPPPSSLSSSSCYFSSHFISTIIRELDGWLRSCGRCATYILFAPFPLDGCVCVLLVFPLSFPNVWLMPKERRDSHTSATADEITLTPFPCVREAMRWGWMMYGWNGKSQSANSSSSSSTGNNNVISSSRN